jgi:hypothetical protein
MASNQKRHLNFSTEMWKKSDFIQNFLSKEPILVFSMSQLGRVC